MKINTATDGCKVCTGCRESKALSEFGPRTVKGVVAAARQAQCRACKAAYAKKWRIPNVERIAAAKKAKYAEDPERHRAVQRAWRDANPGVTRRMNLRKRGITVEDYDRMLLSQNGMCAACGSHDNGDRRFDSFAVDHDHDSGKVRGLLCSGCNLALGHLKDNPDRLLALAAYVLQHSDVLAAA